MSLFCLFEAWHTWFKLCVFAGWVWNDILSAELPFLDEPLKICSQTLLSSVKTSVFGLHHWWCFLFPCRSQTSDMQNTVSIGKMLKHCYCKSCNSYLCLFCPLLALLLRLGMGDGKGWRCVRGQRGHSLFQYFPLLYRQKMKITGTYTKSISHRKLWAKLWLRICVQMPLINLWVVYIFTVIPSISDVV